MQTSGTVEGEPGGLSRAATLMRAATMARAATLHRTASYTRRPRFGSTSPMPPEDGAQAPSRAAAAAAVVAAAAATSRVGAALTSLAESGEAAGNVAETAAAWRTNPASDLSNNPSPRLHPAGGGAASPAELLALPAAHAHEHGAAAHVLFSDGPGRRCACSTHDKCAYRRMQARAS